MKDTLHFKALTQKNCYAVSSLTEDTLFVDIETTGLSAEKITFIASVVPI